MKQPKSEKMKILLGILLSSYLFRARTISVNENKHSRLLTLQKTASNFDLLQVVGGTRRTGLIDGDKYAENVLGVFYTPLSLSSDTCSHAPSEISRKKFFT
jgi:hypothetical protein